jgi:hypothetical protein
MDLFRVNIAATATCTTSTLTGTVTTSNPMTYYVDDPTVTDQIIITYSSTVSGCTVDNSVSVTANGCAYDPIPSLYTPYLDASGTSNT